MFVPSKVPSRFRDAYSQAEQRIIRKVTIRSAWIVLIVGLIAHSAVLIRGSSLIPMDLKQALMLKLPPVAVSLAAVLLHYLRFPGPGGQLIMLRLISLSAMWSVFGLLALAYEEDGNALRVMTELTIISIFCASIVSLRGIRGATIPLFIPMTGFVAYMLYRGHEPLDLLQNLMSFISAMVVAVLIAHVLFKARVQDFVSRQELYEQSTVDLLTGLNNRRAMSRTLEAERARYHRQDNSFAIILLDLDHFKRVNDELGHEAGDILLTEVAGRLIEHTREQDSVARWGGEEFLVLLPDTDEKGAVATAEKLRNALEEAPFKAGTTGVVRKQTGSFGVAVYDGRETAAQLISRADKALYFAKECGRNRAVMS